MGVRAEAGGGVHLSHLRCRRRRPAAAAGTGALEEDISPGLLAGGQPVSAGGRTHSTEPAQVRVSRSFRMCGGPYATEVFSVDEVACINTDDAANHHVRAFLLPAAFGPRRKQQCFWLARRRPSVRPNDEGTDMFLVAGRPVDAPRQSRSQHPLDPDYLHQPRPACLVFPLAMRTAISNWRALRRSRASWRFASRPVRFGRPRAKALCGA